MVEVHGFLHHFLHLNQASVVVVGVLDHHIVEVTNRVILNQVPARAQGQAQVRGNLALVLALNHSLVDRLKNLQSRINQNPNQFL